MFSLYMNQWFWMVEFQSFVKFPSLSIPLKWCMLLYTCCIRLLNKYWSPDSFPFLVSCLHWYDFDGVLMTFGRWGCNKYSFTFFLQSHCSYPISCHVQVFQNVTRHVRKDFISIFYTNFSIPPPIFVILGFLLEKRICRMTVFKMAIIRYL